MRVIDMSLVIILVFGGNKTLARESAPRIVIGAFSQQSLSGWQDQIFNDATQYQWTQEDGVWVLAAHSYNSASGKIKKIRIDLNQTPMLNWRWKIARTAGTINERLKNGDDFPVRVYVIVHSSLKFWQTKALCYIWASQAPPLTSWPNAHNQRIIMIALESGETLATRWVTEKRNIKEDLAYYLKIHSRYIDGIAIMTDSDNTRQVFTGYYGDLYFTTE